MTDCTKDVEPELLSSFENFDEASSILKDLLSASLAIEPSPEENKAELDRLKRLTQIVLTRYQEQPYLIDPRLEELIGPIVNTLRSHVQDYTSDPLKTYSLTRVNRLVWILYNFVKVRGYKTIVRFFPHEVSDLPMVIDYMTSDGPVKDPDAWALRYIMMLWLSLVCMLPFDLAQFDNDDCTVTSIRVEQFGMAELDKSGLERDGAALMLSKLYMRKDTFALLTSFLGSIEEGIRGSPRLFAIIGSLRVLAEITKSAPMELLQPHLLRIQGLVDEVSRVSFLAENTIIRKLRTKCIARTATRLLPAGPKKSRSIGRSLDPSMRNGNGLDDVGADEEQDVPSDVEDALGELFELLQDKDTSVRWSSAKGIANISERLPASFVDQVIDNILGHFSVHASSLTPSELPATAEHPWHGACLACAELARRNLISNVQLPDVLLWMSKALFFDVRKGSFSVGSNVRDAAAYVLWSLARTRSKEALEPYAAELAQSLVTVALFDREIHIRRAASAAFQENVGRMGLFPHGIAIIGLIDFYSVSIRRSAFLIAAPEVSHYKEYHQPVLEHLLKITLRHWDEAMRRLGAQSLRKVCEEDLETNVPKVLDRLSSPLLSVDTVDIHGGLLALSELASAIRESEDNGRMQQYRQKIFRLVDSVPSTMVLSSRNHLITEAACYVISNSISSTESDAIQNSATEPYWRTIVLQGLRHRNSDVQGAAAVAMQSLSRLADCSEDAKRLIKELKRSSAIMQQSLARVLGSFDYLSHRNGFDAALPCLLEVVDPKAPSFFRDVEARRNAYTSLAAIVKHVSPKLNDFISPNMMNRIWQAFFVGLEDYTVNERGDVGSWIRISCVKGLSSMLESLIGEARNMDSHADPAWANSYTSFAQYLPLDAYHKAVGMILKQGVERLDNVRQCVGDIFIGLLKLEHPLFERGQEWSVRGGPLFIDLLQNAESSGWNDGSWLYPRAVRFLNIGTYRNPILRGLLLSIGSKTSSTQQPASSAILAYARDLRPTKMTDKESALAIADSNDLYTLLSDLLAIAHEDPKSNNIVIPILHTFNVLLEGDALSTLLDVEDEQCTEITMKILDLATRNIERLKSMQRIEESMKIVVNLSCVASKMIGKQAATFLRRFLLHPFPKIRSDTAEVLYVALQTKDIEYEEEAEEIILETEWLNGDIASLGVPVERILAFLG